jgi:Protein of unknown function (DUF5672)
MITSIRATHGSERPGIYVSPLIFKLVYTDILRHMGNPGGGNGGFSLRHLPPIISLLHNETRKAGDKAWEDRWLCDRLQDRNDTVITGFGGDNEHLINMPSPTIEKKFSVESIWEDRPLGYHLRGSGRLLPIPIWGNETLRKAIFDYCPEVKLVLPHWQLDDDDEEEE